MGHLDRILESLSAPREKPDSAVQEWERAGLTLRDYPKGCRVRVNGAQGAGRDFTVTGTQGGRLIMETEDGWLLSLAPTHLADCTIERIQ